jgi:L-iditol 2-dehydrogenase
MTYSQSKIQNRKSEIPARMRVARYYAAGDIRLEEMLVPRPGPGEALVATTACGICTGEIVPWYIGRKAPLTPGHEPAGRIAALGPETPGWAVGDRVFVHHHAPCGACPACRRGAVVHCATWRGTKLIPGALADYFLVPAPNLAHDTLRLPDHVSDAAATLIEPLACSIKAMRRAGVGPGSSVVVISLGFMGLLNTALALHLGARLVIAADRVPVRCARGVTLGATRVVNVDEEDLAAVVREHTDGHGAEVVIVGPGSVEALRAGLACTAGGGTLVQFTPTAPGTHWPLDTYDVYFREISLVPSYSCGPDDTRAALALIAAGAFPPERFIDRYYPLSQTAAAFTDMARGAEVVKAVLTFEERET